MTPRLHLWLTAAAVALAAPAQAANLALVLDAAPAGEADDGIVLLGDALNAQGYEVYERTAADRPAMREAIGAFAARLDEAERAVIVFAGPIQAAEGRVWLLPSDFDGQGLVDAAFDGVALELLLALAAERPGRSAVVVAYDEAELDDAADEAAAEAEAAEAARSWARADVPQGVLVLVGPRAAAIEAVSGRLLEADVTAEQAVEELDEVRVYGFASPHAGFGELADASPPIARPEVEVVDEPDEPSPEATAEAAEAALGLDQTARRRVQEDLTVLGYSTRGIDGIFGPGTRGAVAEWQEAQGVEATGYLTAEQVARLREQAAARSAELAAEAERARAAEEAADAAFWRVTGAGGTAADLRAYLARYPDGVYAAEARAELAALEAEAQAAADAEDREAWEAAAAADDADAYRTYLEARPDGAFAGEAEARLQAIEEAPRDEAVRAEAQAREEALGLNRASRALIEGQLAAVGYDVGAADGGFDDDTRRAIREFQTRQGLEVTGYVDQATVQALIVASLGLR